MLFHVWLSVAAAAAVAADYREWTFKSYTTDQDTWLKNCCRDPHAVEPKHLTGQSNTGEGLEKLSR